MSYVDDAIPVLSETVQPPLVRGTADLADFANQGKSLVQMQERIENFQPLNPPPLREVAQTYDRSIAAQFVFRRAEGLDLQDAALAASQIYRVGALADQSIRLLALMGPGDMMANTPLDFLTNHLDVRLDLLYVLPDRPLPSVIPNHDIAFFGLGEPDPETFVRLNRLFASWPRPVLNNPRFLPALERDTLSRSLAGIPGLCSPTAVAVTRSELEQHVRTGTAIPGFEACLSG